MIYVTALIEKKEIGMTETKEGGADAIEKADGQEQRENTQQNPMDVKSIAGPRLDPGKARVFEKKGRINPPSRDPVTEPNQLHHPKHDSAECDSEKNERRDVDRRKEFSL